MKDVIITSSVLITALLILRRLFTKTISRRFQYALWSLVLLRLLIPVSLPAVNFSVLTAAQPAQESVTATIDSQIVYYRPAAETSAPYLHVQQEPVKSFTNVSSISDGYSIVSEDGETSVTYSEMLTLSQILRGIWIFGMIVMACWFAASNLHFYIMLRKNRTPFVAGLYTHRVWLVEKGLSSPCLFGLIKPSFYLTPASAADEKSLRYVMLHEETHVQHHDLLWSFLRCVCLTVYWFNPLVWLAAAASRTDCELACDESVIRTLSGDERIAYGKTLLSLVPVKNTPQNPLLSATTMTAGKKKLTDRIVRIAENRSTAVTALAAVIVIAALVCTVTFTSAADKVPSEEPLPAPVSGGSEELDYFNNEFFNGEAPNTHNMLLSSVYASPEDIDLFELFYSFPGIDEISDEETALVGMPQITSSYKFSHASIDALLTEYLGLTLDETNKIGLEKFDYLPEYDSYYLTHGDNSYFFPVTVTAVGHSGDLVYVFYNDYMCVTLRETEAGGYQFVSNLPYRSASSSVEYPKEDPVLTISMIDFEPYEAPKVSIRRHKDDCAELLSTWNTGSSTVYIYLSTDGNIYAAILYSDITEEWDVGCFLYIPNEGYTISYFSSLFGSSGFVISHQKDDSGEVYNYLSTVYTLYDYYVFDADGTPSILLRAFGNEMPEILDLDSNGDNELIVSGPSTAQLFFRRGRQIYEVNFPEVLEEAWDEMELLDYCSWDAEHHCLFTRCYAKVIPEVKSSVANTTASEIVEQKIYFDRSELLAYSYIRVTIDHVAEGVTAPDYAINAAKEIALGYYNYELNDDYKLDDWRIIDVYDPYYTEIEGLNIECWNFSYEFHTTTPEMILAFNSASSAYVTEESWRERPGLLFFLINEDGSRTFMFADMLIACEFGSEDFNNSVLRDLRDNGYLPTE